MAELSAKQAHRVQVERLHGRRCWLRHRGRCSGRLQADHVIGQQRLKTYWNGARFRRERGLPTIEADRVLLEVGLETLIADGRNGWMLCERHHGMKTAHLLAPMAAELPSSVWEFARDYSLTSEVVVVTAPNERLG
jgi:hypothetical protein